MRLFRRSGLGGYVDTPNATWLVNPPFLSRLPTGNGPPAAGMTMKGMAANPQETAGITAETLMDMYQSEEKELAAKRKAVSEGQRTILKAKTDQGAMRGLLQLAVGGGVPSGPLASRPEWASYIPIASFQELRAIIGGGGWQEKTGLNPFYSGSPTTAQNYENYYIPRWRRW